MQCNEILCDAMVLHYAMQWNTMQCDGILCNAMKCHTMQCNWILCNAMEYYAMQWNTMQYYGTALCNAMKYYANNMKWSNKKWMIYSRHHYGHCTEHHFRVLS